MQQRSRQGVGLLLGTARQQLMWSLYIRCLSCHTQPRLENTPADWHPAFRISLLSCGAKPCHHAI